MAIASSTSLASAGTVGVGTGATGYYLYAGNFDNVYYDSSNNTGNLYVVGNTGATTGAILYQVGLSGGFLTGTATAVVTGLTASGAYPWPSPVTEFCNNGANHARAANRQRLHGDQQLQDDNLHVRTDFTSADMGATDHWDGYTIWHDHHHSKQPHHASPSRRPRQDHTSTGTATIGVDEPRHRLRILQRQPRRK